VTPPRRQLGLSVTAAIVVANMIGTGVFTTTGFSAAALHDPPTILMLWVVGGVIALCGAAAYAELGSLMPRAGGEYVYLREAYHPAVGFMSGWVSLTAGFSGAIATSSLAFALYLGKLFPALEHAAWVHSTIGSGTWSFTIAFGLQQAVAMLLVVVITVMHSFDTKVGGWVQAAFTAAKVLLIALFIIGGVLLGTGNWGNLSSQNGGLANVGTKEFAVQLIYVSFSYSGWNAAAYIASDVRKPAWTLPRALLLGTVVVMALYVLLNLVFLYALPTQALAGVEEVGDKSARALFGEGAGRLVTSVIALALVSSVSAMIMAGPRVYSAMAADRALPAKLAVHNKRGVPSVAVVTQGVIACLFILVGDLGALMRFVGFTLSIFAALTVGAVFVMRARGKRSAYQTWGYPVTPILFIALSAWMAYSQFDAHPKESLIVVALLAVGALVYWVVSGGKPPIPNENDPIEENPLPTARVVSD
jgi:basic amino acid/polyamine antiporter, APA family